MRDLSESQRENIDYFRRQAELITARLALLPKGAIKTKKIGQETFYYLQYRLGRKVKDDYIGKKIPRSLRDKLAERKRLEKQLAETGEALRALNDRKKRETDLVEPLRSVLLGMTKNKLWESGLEIIGSWCFLLYQRVLPFEKYPFKTLDLDILIPLPYRGKPFDLAGFLRRLGFSDTFNLDGSVSFSGNNMKIEFLGPERGDGLKPPKPVGELRITPQMLHYVDILFKDPLLLKIAKGTKALVPTPAAFTVHKLMIANHFRRTNKKEKDIRQAVYAAKYVLSEKVELEKLLRIWETLPRSWKTKARRAIADAVQILPQEEGTIRSLINRLT